VLKYIMLLALTISQIAIANLREIADNVITNPVQFTQNVEEKWICVVI